MYDIIGDIHGHSKTLIKLLEKLNYRDNGKFYEHPSRKVIFTGDFIDRGSNIKSTLKIVKSMVDNNSAYAVMGNHEYNAIMFNSKNSERKFLREHSPKNIRQHKETLNEFKNDKFQWHVYLNWFKTLPIFIDFPKLRVIHACWDFEKINFIKENLPNLLLTNEFMLKASVRNSKEYETIEILLKGKEINLPKNLKFRDKDGIPRNTVRIKWWVKPENATYSSISASKAFGFPEIKVPEECCGKHVPYLENEKPVFIGHYWKSGSPEILTPNVCCVDYSIGKNEKLVAYRFNGEKILNNNNFIFVENVD